jgi:hypothetical protein
MSVANVQISELINLVTAPIVKEGGSGFFFGLTWGLFITVVFLYDGFMELREAYEAAMGSNVMDFWEAQPGLWIGAITLTVIVIEESKEFAWPLWELMKGNKLGGGKKDKEASSDDEEIAEDVADELAWDITDCGQYDTDEDYFGCLDLCEAETGESCE